MRFDFRNERLLAVVAHPDDVELLCAGTLARARADAADIAVCTICRGDKGGSGDLLVDLAERRAEEFSEAANVIGATPFLMDAADGELQDSPAVRRQLMRVFRQFRPTTVLTHAPEDYHPDHQAASAIAESVSWLACSAGHQTQQPPLPTPPALLWMDTVNMLGFQPGFFVDISDFMGVKEEMLACHRSQLLRGEETGFESLQELMRRQAGVRGAQAGVEAAEAFRVHLAWKRVPAW
jgi:LmbE family N-acetylglucosaminyl deacetylase